MKLHRLQEWKPLKGRPVLCISVHRRSKSYGRVLSLWPIACMSTLSV